MAAIGAAAGGKPAGLGTNLREAVRLAGGFFLLTKARQNEAMRFALLAVAATLFAASPAVATEIYGGLSSHGANWGITICCYEPGPDVQFGLTSSPLKALSKYGDFRVYGLGSVNTRGGVSFGAVGFGYRWHFANRFYFQPAIGGAVQSGDATGYQKTPDKLYLGSRFLFEPQVTLGYEISPKWAVEASWAHISHAQLAGPQNPGLDDVGGRIVYRF
jgi:lipid A 3-O-deacylase